MPELTSLRDVLQDLLPGHRDWKAEQQAATEKKVDRIVATWDEGMSGEALWLAKCLVYCGFPVKLTPEKLVERKARTSKNEVLTVTFSQGNSGVPLPYGHDRLMAHFLTTRSVMTQSRLLGWDDVNDYLTVFGKYERSGYHHRAAQERFIRLAFLNLTLTYTNLETGKTRVVHASPIDLAEIDGVMNEETGKWSTTLTPKKMLRQYSDKMKVGELFFNEFLKRNKAIPVPFSLISNFAHAPRLLDFATFLYYRCYIGQSKSLITWRQLQAQFDNHLSTDKEWRRHFREALKLFRLLPDPFPKIHVDVEEKGITVHPLPPGTTFFHERPKLADPADRLASE